MRILSSFLVLSLATISNSFADMITVIAGDNSNPANMDYHIGELNTETGVITRIKGIPHQTAFAPGLSTADPVTGKFYNFDNSSPGTGFSIYDSQTNTTTRSTATLGAQIFAV